MTNSTDNQLTQTAKEIIELSSDLLEKAEGERKIMKEIMVKQEGIIENQTLLVTGYKHLLKEVLKKQNPIWENHENWSELTSTIRQALGVPEHHG
jgi:hypothetical protein